MEKKLSDYFSVLINNRETILNEFYEEGSLMLSEEATIICGLLVGINILDCNLCLKGEDLDLQSNVIDFSYYLKDIKNLHFISDEKYVAFNIFSLMLIFGFLVLMKDLKI